MIFVPLPFVVALLLVILLVRLLRHSEQGIWDNRLFILLIGAYALQSVLIGVRWGYDFREILPLQSILATLIAPLAWISFRSLTIEEAASSEIAGWQHLLPAILVIALLIAWREPIGIVITLVFLSYGAALLWLARRGPDALVVSRIDGVVLSYRSLLITGIALVASAATDVIISFDFAWNGGTHSGAVVAIGNVVSLLVLGGAASVASFSRGHDDRAEALPHGVVEPQATEEDAAVAVSVNELMQSKRLYTDTELNLGRIARKLNLPARRVSLAINRIHKMSVSQYVNDHRIREACRLLASTDAPVTRVMFDSGFISKSNFNREFLRVTGLTPTLWRQRERAPHEPCRLPHPHERTL
ncbi:AraC family transcriptional regulator [Mesorhizobium soli]|uniref:AraC family transcriptional regulator n=2 Tax=Pseudaminobacter soli (ex Li et al. 2025) TaxID=1295366 RepID=A0A2P7S0G2_9HYPH|nr:AraC family transcriptional regulator [Mesorhizobium soli]